ncbi:hypothetical protein DFP72DRAFT_1179311 [Ephemerocybe angulata]|uniref:Uncharacterized protein n=1 Tax=Ephemerocybe angulata TaxID=980116 RepID=A0A8H6LVH0_9AGAR|nr:hypothetical protein DFP72DRAFT_1179308 [Tulosesus angulatus]KAF6742294.1 hypothetical protein DFP72DRAFT_1179311 [Tulosesus angulatus]
MAVSRSSHTAWILEASADTPHKHSNASRPWGRERALRNDSPLRESHDAQSFAHGNAVAFRRALVRPADLRDSSPAPHAALTIGTSITSKRATKHQSPNASQLSLTTTRAASGLSTCTGCGEEGRGQRQVSSPGDEEKPVQRGRALKPRSCVPIGQSAREQCMDSMSNLIIGNLYSLEASAVYCDGKLRHPAQGFQRISSMGDGGWSETSAWGRFCSLEMLAVRCDGDFQHPARGFHRVLSLGDDGWSMRRERAFGAGPVHESSVHDGARKFQVQNPVPRNAVACRRSISRRANSRSRCVDATRAIGT